MTRFCSYCQVEHPLIAEHWYRLDSYPRCKLRVQAAVKQRYAIKSVEVRAYNAARYRRIRKLKRKPADLLQVRLKARLRGRISKALVGGFKGGSAVRDLGCSIAGFRVYLEQRFLPGMTWANYGKAGWHLDHICPLVKFDLSDPEEFRRAAHYTNLQPLWAVDNYRKGGR